MALLFQILMNVLATVTTVVPMLSVSTLRVVLYASVALVSSKTAGAAEVCDVHMALYTCTVTI